MSVKGYGKGRFLTSRDGKWATVNKNISQTEFGRLAEGRLGDLKDVVEAEVENTEFRQLSYIVEDFLVESIVGEEELSKG